MCTRFLFLVCFIFCFFFVEGASWTVPEKISRSGGNAAFPQVAIDPFGNAVAVWSQFDGHHLIIQSSQKPLNGNWQTIPDCISPPNHDASFPQILIDSYGNITVIWEQFDGMHTTIGASVKLFGKDWQAIPDCISSSNYNVSSPQMAVDSMGNITVVWVQLNGSESIIKSSTKGLKKRWQSLPSTLSLPEKTSSNPVIVIDSLGNSTVAWQQFDGYCSTIQVLTRIKGEDWQKKSEQISSSGCDVSSPNIAVDRAGNITAVWHQTQGDIGVIQASSKTFNGKWSKFPSTLSLPGYNAFNPKIAIDQFGNAIAIWEKNDKSKGWPIVQVSMKSFNGSWQREPDNLSDPSSWICNPQIVVDQKGNVIVIMQHLSREFGYLIKVSTKAYGKKWKTMKGMECISILNPSGQNSFSPHIAVDSYGNTIAVWYQFYGNESVIESSYFKRK